MTSITSLYLVLTVIIFLSILVSVFALIITVLKTMKLHRFRQWYKKKSFIRNLINFVLIAALYLISLYTHSTSQTPGIAEGVSQDAINVFETTMLVYRTLFMYMLVIPLFLITIFYLYKTIFIGIRLKKQRVNTYENQLLKDIADGTSKDICKSYKSYINDNQYSKTTPFSYTIDTFLLKCLDKNQYSSLSHRQAQIIESKQKHKKYNRKINRMYLGDYV
ncbi:hypothetical protein [Staphylococcus shinii]|uniref:hypothetical protein n=1 Tax=Staphylococcus shinii TaxID=2912228 RepID=UPI003EEA32BA